MQAADRSQRSRQITDPSDSSEVAPLGAQELPKGAKKLLWKLKRATAVPARSACGAVRVCFGFSDFFDKSLHVGDDGGECPSAGAVLM